MTFSLISHYFPYILKGQVHGIAHVWRAILTSQSDWPVSLGKTRVFKRYFTINIILPFILKTVAVFIVLFIEKHYYNVIQYIFHRIKGNFM